MPDHPIRWNLRMIGNGSEANRQVTGRRCYERFSMQSAAEDLWERLASPIAAVVSVFAAAAVWARYHSATPDPAKLAPTDLANYYYPVADTVGRRLAAGELPLWNSASCSGIPLLATLQPGVLYPFNWLTAVGPTADAMWLAMLVQVLLAAGFTAAALRAMGLHAAAAGLGGVLYVHACLLGNLAWPPSVAVMTWLPLQWLCVEKLVFSRSRVWWVVLAAATGLQLLAGFPQYAVYGFYWLVPYAAVRLWESRKRVGAPERRVRQAVMMVAAVALGAGLAAAQLFPTAELAAQSARGVELSAEDVHYLDVGTLPARQIVSNAFDPRPKNPTFDLKAGTGYLGIASLFGLVAMLVLRWRSPTTWYLAGAGVFALAMSDGFHGALGPVFTVYHELPTGGLFRTPERLRFITMICSIALTCGGLDALLRRGEGRPSGALLLGFAVVVGAVVVLGADGSGWRLVLALTIVGTIAIGPAHPRLRSLSAVAFVLFVVVDLALATAPAGVLHAYPRELSERYHAAFKSAKIGDDLLAELQSLPGRPRVEPYGFFPFQAAGPAFGLHRAACYEPLSPGQWRELSEVLSPGAALKGGIANPGPERAPVFYDVASVSRVVRPRRGQAVVVQNEDALPRAYQVAFAEIATQQGAFSHIRDRSFDFQTGVLLEEDVADASDSTPSERVAARIVSHAPERVEVALAQGHSGWLVLTDTHYPGWEAEIDGRAAPVLRANGVYRAVRVTGSDERVVFHYRPASFAFGIAASLASLGGVVWVVVARGRWLLGASDG